MNKNSIVSMIDHTILKADARKSEIIKLCEEAKNYGFASVCVNTCHVPMVSNLLEGSPVKVCCVIGFPLGAMSTEAKVFETKQAVSDGAREIDMVINIGSLLDGDYDQVKKDIASVVEAAHPEAIVKVIIEACLLNEEQKIKVCQLSVEAGADYVKTSTGFSTGGAVIEDISLMKAAVENKAKVKASGGIKTLQNALDMVEAGADRIGTSNGVMIAKELKHGSDYGNL